MPCMAKVKPRTGTESTTRAAGNTPPEQGEIHEAQTAKAYPARHEPPRADPAAQGNGASPASTAPPPDTSKPAPQPTSAALRGRAWKPVCPTAQRAYDAELFAELE